WSATGLPSGLNLTARGVLSGTPGSSGSFTPLVTLADNASNSTAKSLTLSISGASAPPPPPPSLTILTAALPNGTAGVPYGPFGLAASGGSGNYSWSLTGAPAGVSVTSSGVISGTPTTAGTFSVSASVTDAGLFAQRSFTITIGVGPL